MQYPLVVLDDVRLTLQTAAGSVNILRGLSLGVARGETVGVVGPSGSGKSTMLAVIAGLERPSAGRVAVAGADLAPMDEDALARFRRVHVGIVFQSFHLVPTMTAVENVAVPLELAGRADAFDRAADCLEAVGVAQRSDHYPAQLSGGEQQRVALARAIVAEPDLVLADEPTGNLDGATGQAIVDLVFDIQARLGTTLVLVTHDAAVAERCGRIVHLADGRVVEADAAAEAGLLSRGVS
ncbi:MAG: ABC transporter ATP-binding protein [Alphaproteobacteria bacterium]